jgi:hypothetical protein
MVVCPSEDDLRGHVGSSSVSYIVGPKYECLSYRLAILNEVFRGFPLSLNVNAGVLPKIGSRRPFLAHPLQFIIGIH